MNWGLRPDDIQEWQRMIAAAATEEDFGLLLNSAMAGERWSQLHGHAKDAARYNDLLRSIRYAQRLKGAERLA